MKRILLMTVMLAFLLVGCAGEKKVDKEESQSTVNSNTEESSNMESDNNEREAGQSGTDNRNEEVYVLTFEASTIEGDTLTSHCFADSKLTMINVWATYCNPCISEMPDLGEIAASYDKAEFQIIGIVSDVTEDAEEKMIDTARNLVEDTGANYPHLLLNESLYTNLVEMVDAVPTTFFVNRKGEVLGYAVGSQSKETWEELIDEILAEVE